MHLIPLRSPLAALLMHDWMVAEKSVAFRTLPLGVYSTMLAAKGVCVACKAYRANMR